jgi:hypothetical protein
VHGSNARNLLYSYPYLTLAKCYSFLIIAHVFSSTKLEKRAEQVQPGSKDVSGMGIGRNGPMYACMNK